MTVQFVAPSDEALDQVAQSICLELGRQNPMFLRPEVWHGLAIYLKGIATVHVRIANARPEQATSFTRRPRVA